MVKTLFNRLLLLVLYASGAGLVITLLRKKETVGSLAELGVAPPVIGLPVVNALYSPALGLLLLGVLGWLAFQQFRIKSIDKRLKLNGGVLLGVWALFYGWVYLFLLPIFHLME